MHDRPTPRMRCAPVIFSLDSQFRQPSTAFYRTGHGSLDGQFRRRDAVQMPVQTSLTPHGAPAKNFQKTFWYTKRTDGFLSCSLMGLDMGAFDNAWQLLKEDGPYITWQTPEKRMGYIDGKGPYDANSIYEYLKRYNMYDSRIESVSGE